MLGCVLQPHTTSTNSSVNKYNKNDKKATKPGVLEDDRTVGHSEEIPWEQLKMRDLMLNYNGILGLIYGHRLKLPRC